MGQKDIVEKYLESYNDVFADIINVLIFGGSQIVKPGNLTDAQNRSQYKADTGKLHEQERDTSKFWSECGIYFALLGFENQTNADADAPIRILNYDGASYRSQLRNKSKERFPVVTLILYFGRGHWNQPKNIKGMCKIRTMLDKYPRLETYVQDYSANVIEVSWLTDEQVRMFTSDFHIVADYFTQIRKTGTYIGSKQKFQHVTEVLQFLSVFTGDSRFKASVGWSDNEKEPENMCEVLDRIENRGKAEGKAEGKVEGKAEGENNLISLYASLKKDGRNEEAEQIMRPENTAMREQLYKEYNI